MYAMATSRLAALVTLLVYSFHHVTAGGTLILSDPIELALYLYGVPWGLSCSGYSVVQPAAPSTAGVESALRVMVALAVSEAVY